MFLKQRRSGCLERGAVGGVCLQQRLRFRRERCAAAVATAGGGVQELKAQFFLGRFEDRPGFGVCHAHAGGGGTQGVVLFDAFEQRGDARSKAFFFPKDSDGDHGA